MTLMCQNIRNSLFGIAAAASMAVVAMPAMSAEATNPAQQDQQAAPDNMDGNQKCRAQTDKDKPDTDTKSGSLTQKLGNCGGVLTPPKVNDGALVKPAPDAGQMPVIKPGQIPQQAPKQN